MDGFITARLVFAGIAVGFALTALTNFLVFASESQDGTRAVMFWILPTLAQFRWTSVPILAGAIILSLCLFTLWSRRFDALAIGDDTALALGTDPTRFRAIAALAVSLTVAVAVAVSGLIGFVGLVVHTWPAGSSEAVTASACIPQRPCSASCCWSSSADALARIAFAPRELPLGILTALIGTPTCSSFSSRRSLAR